jgi:peptidyl-prolyl cis-trans isomerase B (cyclophilin B)
VVPDFVIQGGDPAGNGSGGPGWNIKAEFNQQKHIVGALAMARSQSPDSGGSQFYICLGAPSFLDGNYTVFGQTLEGQEVVNHVAVGDVIKKVTIIY